MRVARLLGRPVAAATRLSGGLLNDVFRVVLADDGSTVVAKHAPPFVAAAPDIPLDPHRATVEARALAAVGPPWVPRLLAQARGFLVMEDLGPLPHLGRWLAGGGDPAVLDALGAWLARHHARPAPALDNGGVQQTRHAVQHSKVGGWLAAARVADAEALGARVAALGAAWLAPGPAFLMGDLWPPSVLVRPEGALRIIDWELAVRGWPAQDLGHLTAHLWLGARLDGLAPGLHRRFLAAYGPVSAAATAALWTHAGAEILARTVGAFARPGLDAAARAQLVADAAHMIRAGAAPGGS